MKDMLLVEGVNELNVGLPPIAPPFDPWSYDSNGDGAIDAGELAHAADDYNAGKITKAEFDQVMALWELAPPFDPWSYDFNGNGMIDTNEMMAASNDYSAGKITRAQLDQVVALWEAAKPPPPPPPECATQAQKDQAAADWQAGLITTQELLRIQDLPLCT